MIWHDAKQRWCMISWWSKCTLGCIKSYFAAGPLKSSKSMRILCHEAHFIALQVPVMMDSLFQKWSFTKDPSSSVSDLLMSLMSSHKAPHPTWTWLATPVRNQGEARPGCAGTPLYLIWTIQEINGAPYSHYIHLYHIFIFIYPIKLGLLLDISDKLGPIHTISLWLYQSIIISYNILKQPIPTECHPKNLGLVLDLQYWFLGSPVVFPRGKGFILHSWLKNATIRLVKRHHSLLCLWK